jgi:hypothetical protein
MVVARFSQELLSMQAMLQQAQQQRRGEQENDARE